jgi:hypothetical protein
MKRVSESRTAAWLRGLVWAAMIFGCAWASAQSYLVSPAAGRYHAVAIGAGEGVGLGLGVEGAGQNTSTKDDLFAGTEVFAKGASDVTEITMDPNSLNLVGGPDEHRAHNMVLNVVRTYTYDKPGMYNMADVDAYRNKLNTGDWHCSVHIRDLKTGAGTDVCAKHRTDGLRETAIISVEPKELTFIHTIRREGPGSSELGYFPMLPGIGPTAMMAMMDPDAFADMQIGLHGMMLNLHPGLTLKMGDLKVKPFDEQQMKQLNEQLKNLKVKPFDQKQMEEMDRRLEELKGMPGMPAPESPETVAPPAPPAAPQSPDAPK